MSLGRTLACCIDADGVAAAAAVGGGLWSRRPPMTMVGKAAGDKLREWRPADGAVRLVVPLDRFAVRYLRLPFADPDKITAILPHELVVPWEPDDMLVGFSVLERDGNGCLVLVVAVPKSAVDALSPHRDRLGMTPSCCCPAGVPLAAFLIERRLIAADALLLVADDHETRLVGVRHGRLCLLRSLPAHLTGTELGRAVANTLRVFTMQSGMEFTPSELVTAGIDGDEVGRRLGCRVRTFTETAAGLPLPADSLDTPVLADCVALAAMPLRRLPLAVRPAGGESAAVRLGLSRRHWLAAAGLFVLATGLWVADLGLAYRQLSQRAARLDARLRTEFHEIMPQVTRIVDPVAQLQAAIAERRRGGDGSGLATGPPVLDLLYDISRAIPRSAAIVVDELLVEPEAVTIRGTGPSFNAIDRLQNDLGMLAWVSRAEINAADLDRGGRTVRFELQLDRREGAR